ncbi:MAG: hypothetical protein CSA97_01300 [Bacteroidetes bacterium]|nr:MAG: hypothetical protein CSA97_01300 [Bacteroidota bacterium]
MNSLRIAFVVPSNLFFAPFINPYRQLLAEQGIAHDIIFWDRENKAEELNNGIAYRKPCARSSTGKIASYWGFTAFAKEQIKQNNYDRLIIFGPQVASFLYRFLRKEYRGQYMIDYRDMSFDQTFMYPFRKALECSALQVVSSPGFINYLPKDVEYTLCHNFDGHKISQNLERGLANAPTQQEAIEVLTIGGIRSFDSNSAIIKALSNDHRFFIRFVGWGPEEENLKQYAKDHHVENISFEGFYRKEEEEDYILASSFMNIFYNRYPNGDAALSNRFYNSLLYGRPMICTHDTVQGTYAAQYGVGLAITDTANLGEKLLTFYAELNPQQYLSQRATLLQQFVDDNILWERRFIKFIGL